MTIRRWLLPALVLCAASLGCQMARVLSGTPLNALNTPDVPTATAVSPAGPSLQAGLSATEPPAQAAPTATPSGPSEYQVPDEGRFHITAGQTAQYKHYPPSSGLHYGQILDWGIYGKDVPPEYWVHNLEHGGIVVLYNCPSVCADVQTFLKAFYMEAPPSKQFGQTKLLISPNHKIDHPVVALAWDWELDLDQPDAQALLDFYNRHLDQGPEAVP